MSSKALFFAGGGSRGAYQAGVALGIYELANSATFRVFSGISAGSINACYLAQHADRQAQASKRLARFWSELDFHHIYHADTLSLARNSLSWIGNLSFGYMKKKKSSLSLLDASPLKVLLEHRLHLPLLERQIRRGHLDSVSCQCFNFSRSQSISFIQGREVFEREFPKRALKSANLTPLHIFASCSIPLVFSPVFLAGEYFADGAIRNTAPLSPVVHSGADKVILVGVTRGPTSPRAFTPSIGSIVSEMLKSLFFDALDSDVERLIYINKSLKAARTPVASSQFRLLDFLYIKPSVDITEIAKVHTSAFPRAMRFLLESLGSETDVSELSSYLLFTPKYINELIALGRSDILAQKEKILQFCQG